MTYENTWLITCGVCCIYPVIAFAAGVWFAKNSSRINWQNINWKFWRRER